MGDIRTSARSAFRPFATDGVPATGAHEPVKSEIVATFGVVEDEIAAVLDQITSNLIVETSWADLAARSTTGLADGDGAEINGDAGTHTDPVAGGTVANSGRFRYSTSPAGWERIGGAAGADNRIAAEAARDEAEAFADALGAVANVFPGKDLSTAVFYSGGTAPAPFRTSEAAALGLVTGVSDAGAGCYVGADLGSSLTDPYAFIRCYVEVGEGEGVGDLPANVYANFFAGAFASYDATVELTFGSMIGTRLAVYTYQGQVSTVGDVASVNVGWDDTKPNCVLGGVQAAIRSTAIPSIAVGDYPPVASAALPPVLHLTAGRPVSLDVRSVLPEVSGDLEVTWSSSQSSAPRKPWFAAGPVIELDPSKAGSTIDVRARQTVGSNVVRWGRQITVESASASASAATPKILLIGDSLFVRQIAYLLDLDLAARGMTPEFIGTVKGWDGANSYAGPFGEARGERRFTDYTGQTSDLSPPPASSAAYLAADVAGRIALNPFLRVATGGDPAEWTFSIGGTDYIFDLDHYLTTYAGTDANRNVEAPDFVLFCLGTNDFLNPGAQGMIEGVQTGFDILYGQTRAALPSAHIGFVSPALGNGPYSAFRAKAHQVRRAIMAKVAAEVTGGDANVDFLDWGIRQSIEAGYAETAGYTDAIGMKALKMTDDIHFEGVNRHAAVDVIGSYIRARV